MIIIKLIGGLGNQLFQYAAGRRLAAINNTALKLDLSNFEGVDPAYRRYSLSVFNIIENFSTKAETNELEAKGHKNLLKRILFGYKSSTVRYQGYDFDPRILDLSGKVLLDGYWQSEKYFKDIESIIRREYVLNYIPDKRFMELAKAMAECESISLHIRRGDYLSGKFSNIYPVLPLEYYYRAAKNILGKLTSPHFFIFTDDIEWLQANFNIEHPKSIVSGTGFKDHEELILMSKCRHHIIANSSFSWWGAWLDPNPNKTVIAPKQWLKVDNYNIDDLLPADWLKI